LVTSFDIISELIRVLKDFKIRLPDEVATELVVTIIRNSILVEPKERMEVVKDDPKDNMFVEAAVVGKADYIVSQDKHLLKLEEVKGIKMVSPEEFNKMFD
jgi:putative PIN family toxin of toxin-antitoxin system